MEDGAKEKEREWGREREEERDRERKRGGERKEERENDDSKIRRSDQNVNVLLGGRPGPHCAADGRRRDASPPDMRAPCYTGVGGERVKRRGETPAPRARLRTSVPRPFVAGTHQPCPIHPNTHPFHARAHLCTRTHGRAPPLSPAHPRPNLAAPRQPPTLDVLEQTDHPHTPDSHPTAPLHRPTPVTMENMNLGQIPAAVP